MKTILKAFIVGLVLSLAGGAVVSAATADPVVGTWTLNLTKSKFEPGRAPQSLTRTYAASDAGLAMTINGVDAGGKAIAMQSTFKYDGTDYPYGGSDSYAALAVKRVNGSTVKSTLKKAGKVVGHSVRTISAHGTVLTLSSTIQDAGGKPHHEVAVFDKQS